MSERNDKPARPATTDLGRRAALRRFGACAAYTAPAMTVLLASRQGHAMGSKHSKKSGGSGGGFSS
jgi:hypothetical protein